ncbi:photosynthetic reaction center cytochrome PufC [Jannaschia sp. KMU-145]|uniref:photosynthetic reaction center cytochrome PufC n=1 Tax=Jannaschia halovivens TaxID=3388667 RepID=UPI00396B0EBE
MFPKWFGDWNAENPTNVFGPAILVGAVGGALFVAAMVVTYGQPFNDEFDQTGPRGTGMQIAAMTRSVDPTIAEYYSEPPYELEAGEQTAGELYENVQVLGEVSDGNFNRLMNAMTQWVSPDEGCTYCHVVTEDGDVNYASDANYTKVVSRRMIQMTQYVNDEWYAHVNANAEVGVNCYTCHRGQPVPSEVWFRIDPVTQATEGWASVQNRATAMSQSTSLPSDALYRYLLEDNRITVHDLESRVPGVPGEGDYASIQDTERTYALMNYFANSLGVNCVFCHNSRAFYDAGQFTPQWATASLAIEMVRDINGTFLEPLGPVYPPERLGPVYADAPKAACKTCHKGYNKPLQGMNMTADWPELTLVAN